MLWDPGSVKNDEEEEHESVPITPILVPLQNKPPTVEKGVPLLVPDVRDLKDQFQQQQNMLTQIKETLIQNESQLSSKGKQMEAYANKLSQIRARSKNTPGKKAAGTAAVGPTSPKLQKKSSKENLTKLECPEGERPAGNSSKNRKGKVSELKKCLEENKIKFEQRTGKELSETKKIESLVEQLKTQLEERDKTIQDLQKTIEEPTPKPESLLRQKPKQKESVASKTTQTADANRPGDDSIEIITLQNKIHELETNVLDLEENLKEKESVIEARTQAVTLLSQDLSLKGKNTLESLEETRQEMRTMQNNFIAIEDQLKSELLDRNNRLATLEEKYRKLESANFELSLRNAEQQEKLVNLQTKYLETDAERQSLKESTAQGETNDKLDELTKKINVLTKELDERNKAMIKMKIEHKNKMKNVNKTLETLKGSDEKAEIIRLSSLLEELENVKTGLENRVAELEDEKASEKKLKDQINELEIIIHKQNEDSALQLERISQLERENCGLMEANREKGVLIESLHMRISGMEAGEDRDGRLKELSERLESMEGDYSRKIEELRSVHRKEMEMLESYYSGKGESVERRVLEEYRISTEIGNIHVEEQIELLIREKQQLLEKLKSLSGVSSTDSLGFEKMEHSDLKDDREIVLPPGEETDMRSPENRAVHLEKIVSGQQHLINELQRTIAEEKENVRTYQQRITELEDAMKSLQDANESFKQQIEMSEATESGKNTKTSTNTKNRIKKIEMELMQSKKTVAEQSEKLTELKTKLQEKEELIKKYTERIELFEKDDWDRQNHWKNAEDEMDSAQELQKKCLSLENSLFELSEDCERLRKENIEVVHLLSEEKVKRRKLLEELEAKPEVEGTEERMKRMGQVLQELEEKVERLEMSHAVEVGGDSTGEKPEQWEVTDLQEKLEWTNVVLTSKETEIFRLQNLLEDRSKALEILEADSRELKRKLAEKEKKIGEVTKELKAKETQLEEISANFSRLQDSVEAANEKTATNEKQLKELLSTVKEMEGDVFRKETELQEIKGILAEKNLDMTNLRNRLEEVNSDLTYSYQEHLENMGKCLRDKESDYEALLSEKNHLEEVNKQLVAEKEDIHNRKVETAREKERIEAVLSEKEKTIAELKEKLEAATEGKDRNQEREDLKIKMKKLAANLKKKAQNEADLMKQVKELEGVLSEREKRVEGLESEVKGVTEKWLLEKTEKEKLESGVRERVAGLEKALEESRIGHEKEVAELVRQIQQLEEGSKRMEAIEREDKGKISHLEAKTAELCQLYERAASLEKQNQEETDREKQTLLQSLAEATGQYEEIKFRHEQFLLEKSEMEKRLEEMERTCEDLATEKSSLEAKTQENLAVIEGLETELKKTADQMKVVEEKLFHSEDRRLSLESKNEEMCKKIMENSENLTTIDDLFVRIDELLASEKSLQNSVRDLQSGNLELKQAVDQITTEKYGLEAELKAAIEKSAETATELKELKNSDEEKSNLVRELTETVEKLKTENKQLSSEYEKLNRDYEQFEVDFKENLENSQNVEKTLKHKIEELANENASLMEKCNLLSEEAHHGEAKQEEKAMMMMTKKKKKSVTFRSDEVEYIKDLKTQLHGYDAKLKRANEEVENLRGELFRERLRHEVSNVVAEAREKVESLRSSPETEALAVAADKPGKDVLSERAEERRFDGSAFFGNAVEEPFLEATRVEPQQQSSELESLMWDDGWGAEGNLEAEYLSGKAMESEKPGSDYESKMKMVETELRTTEAENERLRKELQEQTTKYAKALKKLKEVKAAHERLQSEAKQTRSGWGDLDAAIVEELKCQIESKETKEKELMKNIENLKLEKESLLKRVEVLNAGNDKFLEMKERQDNEVEIWRRKNEELLKEMAELRRERSSKESDVPDEGGEGLATENQELRNRVEALEWKNCELIEQLEEKQEMLEGRAETTESNMKRVMREKSELQREIEELNNVRERLERKLFEEEEKNTMIIGELNDQLTALASENETLQDILGGMKKSAEAAKKDKAAQEQPVHQSKIFDYFRSSPGEELFSVVTPQPNTEHSHERNVQQLEQLQREVEATKGKISELEGLLQDKEEQLRKSREELECLRRRLSEAENEFDRLRLERESERRRFFEVEEEKKQLVQQLENAATVKKDQFETIDLGREANGLAEAENLRRRILDLESLLEQREEEFQLLSQSKAGETESLRQRIFQLEDAVRVRQDELKRLESSRGSEVDALRRRTAELEEFVRFKENELYQVQSGNANEIQSLRQRVFELENAVKEGGGQQQQQRVLELENLLRLKEEEVREKSERLANLESMICTKEEEMVHLKGRLHELEKSYNDSKIEIERLLNEEKLNVEEKFVEPFQENMKIPVAFEVEALSRMLNEEKQKLENVLYELSEKESIVAAANAQVQNLSAKLLEMENVTKESRQAETAHRELQEQSALAKARLEKMVSDLQQELECSNLHLSVTRRELQEFQQVKDEAMANLKSQLFELETELAESRERERTEIGRLQQELTEKTSHYEAAMRAEREDGERAKEAAVRELEKSKRDLEAEAEALRAELEKKEIELAELGRVLQEEGCKVGQMREMLTAREGEVADLKETLTHLQEEIGHFRNFEKQVKDLRVAQIKEAAGSEVSVTPEGHPDLSDWTEHELAELSTRLQSDLDTALYMLHQRDVRCDELTFELMQLLEERDTLQLRLSTALRINEELRSASRPAGGPSSGDGLRESKDLVDQSNDRQQQRARVAGEDLRQLANKISELHSVSYLRDKTVKDESVQRHKEQMNLLSRISESDMTLSRDFQSSPTVLLNWMRGKTTPKVMHI